MSGTTAQREEVFSDEKLPQKTGCRRKTGTVENRTCFRENGRPGATGKTDETERGGYGKGSFKESGNGSCESSSKAQLRPRNGEGKTMIWSLLIWICK